MPEWREGDRERVLPGSRERAPDRLAVEEPLEIRVHGTPLAVVMRTPGRDRDLIAGFLAAEGVIRESEDLAGVEACPDPETGQPAAHVWNAVLAPGVRFDPRERRFAPVGSACGLCGARTLDALERELPPLARPPAELELAALLAAFDALYSRQDLFAATAGSHGAALWTPRAGLLDVAEDVGRHNAVDKLLGARLLASDYPVAAESSDPPLLLVSGRISFELTQKAALAGVPLLAGVGMPTSLAVDAAQRCGQTLLGWVRDGGASVYAGPTRLQA